MEDDAFEGEAFDDETMKEDFENPRNIIALIRDTATNAVVGFTYAEPTAAVYKELYPERKFSEDTAYISDTVIHPKYRKKGLLPVLMHALENELLKRGYLFIERDSADDRTNLKEDEETFADKIKKNNLDRIIAEQRWYSDEYGAQRYFRMRLPK
jgi:GNAT superfamily N-acetyltransferase